MFGILVACLAVLLVILLRRRLNYFSSRGLPYSKPTLTTFLKLFSPGELITYPQDVYDGERDSDNGIIGYFGTFLKPILLVVDPAMVQQIFIKDFSHFQDHGFEVDHTNDPLLAHLFNQKGDKWRAVRNKFLPTFTSGKLKGMIPIIESCAKSLIKDMKQDNNLTQEGILKDLYKRFTVTVIASCAFGIEPDSVKDPNCVYQKRLQQVINPTTIGQLKALFIFSFPKIKKFFKLKFMPQEVDDFYLQLTRDTMEMRKRSGMKRNDFIQLLMELKEKGSVQVDHRDLEEDEKDLMKQQQQLVESEATSKFEMTHELLAAQVFVFIFAGFDNTAYLIATVHYLLSKNKDIQQRVREEVRTAKSKHGGMNYDALKDMKLLDACLSEALRMYPPINTLFRICTKNYTMRNGLTIEKGSRVFIPVKALHHDSKYWRNPEQFNPDRFLTDDIHPGTYLPFGDGPRICIAQRLALLMNKIMLTELIDNYELLPSKKNLEPIKQILLVGLTDFEGGLWGNFQSVKQ